MSKELVISATRHETRVATLEDDQLVEIAIERASEHALAGNIYKGRVSRVLPGMQSAFVKIGLDRDAFLYVSDVLDETAELESGALDDEEDALLADAKATAVPDSGDGDSEPVRDRSRRGRRDRRGRPERGRGDGGERGDAGDREAASTGDRERGETEGSARQDSPESEDDASRRERRGRRGRRRRGRGGREGGARESGGREGGSRFPEEKFAAIEGSEGAEETPRRRAAAEDDSEVRVKRSGQEDAAEDNDSDEFEVLPGESLAKYGGRAFVEDDDIEYEDDDSEEGDSEAAGDEEPLALEPEEEDDDVLEPADEPDAEGQEDEPAVAASASNEEDDSDDQEDEPEAALAPEEVEAAAEAVSEEAVSAEDSAGDEPEEEKSSSESAEVRERSGSRYLRRGRRGRRRGGRGRRDARERSESPTDETPQGDERSDEDADEAGRSRPPRVKLSEEPAKPERAPAVDEREVTISDLLKPGQEVIVQVAKEPLGKKGARITAHVALPGRHLVYMPTVAHVGVSRKIGSDAERARLRRVIKEASVGIPGGFIVRTAGQGASDEELQEDIRFLANLWKAIKEKAEKRPAPMLLHQDLDVVERFLRDQLGQNFKTIWVDSEDHYESIVQFVQRFQPELLDRVKLYTRSKPIFDEFKITTELEKALRPKVWLKSGGYIVINQTEALVAIDVNTGKYVGKSDRLEDTIVKTNLEAVQEVVRQIRLRDLGGIIVVDFIDMDDRSNRKKVAQALEKELRLDRAPSKALSFNDFGLVAITRKRVKQSLERALCSPCPTCDASGYVKSPTTVILEILHEARKLAPKVKDAKDVILRVNPDVARALKSRDNTFLQEIEDGLKVNVLVRGDLALHRENFDFNL